MSKTVTIKMPGETLNIDFQKPRRSTTINVINDNKV